MKLENTQNIFNDRLKLFQKHICEVPRLAGGISFTTDMNADKVEKFYYQHYQKTGSYSTSIQIKSDPESRTVQFEGNPGRYGRPDNLINPKFEQCLEIANQILAQYDIPPFTTGHVERHLDSTGIETAQTDFGAKIINADTTMNIATGSRSNALATINSFRIMKFGKTELNRNGNHPTSLLYGSQDYKAVKIYMKADDIRKKISSLKKSKPYQLGEKNAKWHVDYLQSLAEYLDQQGCIRFELTGRDMLARKKINRLRDINNETFDNLFLEEVVYKMHNTDVINKREDIPRHLQSTYYLYVSGQPIREILSTRTYFRHKKELGNIGIDISQPVPDKKILNFRRAIKVIEMTPLELPDWYQFPKAHTK